MDLQRLTDIAKDRERCDFCPDYRDESACMACKKVEPISCEELRIFYKTVIEALQEKSARENPQPLAPEELNQMDGEPYKRLDAYESVGTLEEFATLKQALQLRKFRPETEIIKNTDCFLRALEAAKKELHMKGDNHRVEKD